jgi:GT2 family glycosyltransferase
MIDDSLRASVIIPNWNGAEHLPECLDSLASQTFRDFEVVVVDNGSDDDSLELLERDYAWVRTVRNGSNLGFPAAVNAGIRATSTEYVVLLNNDTRAASDWLEQLITAMDAQSKASFAACKMLHYDPPHPIDSAGDRFSLLRGGGLNVGFGEPAGSHDEPAWIFGACAGAAIYRRSLFEDIGLFDEDFFLVFEDIDFDLRAQVAGHRCLYVPEAVVYHKRGASTDNRSAVVATRSLRNLIWTAGKNLPPLILVLWMICFVLRVLIEAIKLAVLLPLRKIWRSLPEKIQRIRQRRPETGPPLDIGLTLRALIDGFGTLARRRRAVRSLRRLGSWRLLPVLVRPVRPLSD